MALSLRYILLPVVCTIHSLLGLRELSGVVDNGQAYAALDFDLKWPKVSTMPKPDRVPTSPPKSAAGSAVETSDWVAPFLNGLSSALNIRLDQLATFASNIDERANALVAQCRELLSGGKRLRAVLAFWSFMAQYQPDASTDGQAALTEGQAGLTECQVDPTEGQTANPKGQMANTEAIIQLGVALELFQASALFHDDILDNSDVRRGFPTAHRTFAQQHRNQNLTGDSQKFGNNVAILLGDLALSLAYDALNSAISLAALAPGQAELARTNFSAMCQEVIIGQYLDILLESEPLIAPTEPLTNQIDLSRAAKVVSAKAASYCARYPLVLGAIFAGVPNPQLTLLSDIGEKLGVAFQLRDDILGIYGDETKTGKPAGDDLREGKRTVLLLETLKRANHGQYDALTAIIGNQNLTTTDLKVAKAAIRETGALAKVERLAETLAAHAIAQLSALPLAEPGKSQLIAVARTLTDRDA